MNFKNAGLWLVALMLLTATPAIVFAAGACCDDEGVCTIVADESACETLTYGAATASVTVYYEGDATTCDPNPCVATFIDPVEPSSRERYVFRNGYLTDGVTAGLYDGARLLMIDQQNATTNYVTNEAVYIGTDGVGEYRGLLSFDISALPDSFVVDTALLFMLRVDNGNVPSIGNTWGLQDHGYIEFYRVFRNWVDDEVTWNNAATAEAWSFPGTDNANTEPKWKSFGSPVSSAFRTGHSTLFDGRWTSSTVTPRYQIAGHYVGVGADTLRWQATTDPGDRGTLPDYIAALKGRHLSYQDAVWMVIKVTDLVVFYHRNPDQNIGWVLKLDGTSLAAGYGTELRGTAATIGDEAPFLMIYGVDGSEVAISGGGGGPRIAGAGTGHAGS